MRNNPQARRGSALITALFIMTLVAIAATAMSTRLQLDIYRTRISIAYDKLYLASQAVTWWTMEQLAANDAFFMTKNSRGDVLIWPPKLQRIYPGVRIEGHVFDMQSKFNLNNLQDKKFQSVFSNLLENIGTIDAGQQQIILDATINWITSYQLDRGHDAFLNYYLKQKPPYYPGFQPMQTLSEFRLVQGVSNALYQALLPYITALPGTMPININTASNKVLKSLGAGLSSEQADTLIQLRGKKGISNASKLGPLLTKLNIPGEQITIASEYFLCVATTSMDDFHLTVYTLIRRHKGQKNKVLVSIVNERVNSQ